MVSIFNDAHFVILICDKIISTQRSSLLAFFFNHAFSSVPGVGSVVLPCDKVVNGLLDLSPAV